MTHNYELRRFNDDGSMTTVLKLVEEPKNAKKSAKSYANKEPGIYSLQKIDTVAMYCTKRWIDKND